MVVGIRLDYFLKDKDTVFFVCNVAVLQWFIVCFYVFAANFLDVLGI